MQALLYNQTARCKGSLIEYIYLSRLISSWGSHTVFDATGK